jgi:pyrroloquinoline-quinone synthase
MRKSRAPNVTACADAALAAVSILDNPFFRDLAGGTMPLETFRRTQERFFWAVSFFSRPMSAMVARIPDARARLDILHNVVEEHGDFRREAFHEETFRAFLRSVGSTGDPAANGLTPEVRAFNAVLTASCVLDEIEVGIACMGIVEYAFSPISAAIGAAVVARGWVPQNELVHYALHASIDPRHAEEFFAVIEPKWEDPARRYYIEQGIQLGAYVFDRLYRDLYAGAITS